MLGTGHPGVLAFSSQWLFSRTQEAPGVPGIRPRLSHSRGRADGSSCVLFYVGGNFSLRPAAALSSCVTVVLCRVSCAPANQQAGSGSWANEVEGNMEEGSFPSQVWALWGGRMEESILLRQPVAPVTGLFPDAHAPCHLTSGEWTTWSLRMAVAHSEAMKRSRL